MSKLKKVLLMCTACALVAVLAIGGTLAYLTDRDSKANVFTVGDVEIKLNENFEQGSTLIPGVDIKKEATITNTGDNDAWVWLTVLLPEEMGPYTAPDNMSASNNVVHWNYPADSASNITVKFNPTPVAVDTDGDGVAESYYQTNMLWKNVLKAGETTDVMLSKVYMDTRVDIDPDGNMYWVVNGVATDLNWNVNDKGNPVIHVSAYAIQTEDFANVEEAYAAYNKQWGDNGAEYGSVNSSDTWDGTADTSWYNDADTTFTLTSAEQLAGMNQLIGEGVTFEGKTIKLGIDMDMNVAEHEWAVSTKSFFGVFDGQGHTISNIGRTVANATPTSGRMGLFGSVEDATVKNLNIDSAAFYGYGPYGGIVTGDAYGKCVFENITITNSINEMYNTGSAGIVGLAYSDSDYTFKGINIDSSNSIGGYWGTYDIAAGGLIGYFWKNGDALSPVSVEDCYLAQQMNVYNDVCANYQWYAYRYSGMLIGYVNGSTTKVDGTTYPLANTVTCKDVTVEYGDWANYYYCELESNGHPSYAGENDYKFSRLVPISSVDEMSSEEYAWDNHFVLIDGDNVTCYHVTRDSDTREITGYHTHTEAEDNVCVELTFDQLYGGGQGVYGDSDHDGVTIIYNNK